ncbi:MAG: hypothetical protein WCS27_03830 [Victivallaceae bacterium]
MKKNIKKILAATATVAILILLLLKFSNDPKTGKVEPKVYRPVTALKLREVNPELSLMLTGVVKSWKEECSVLKFPNELNGLLKKVRKLVKTSIAVKERS